MPYAVLPPPPKPPPRRPRAGAFVVAALVDTALATGGGGSWATLVLGNDVTSFHVAPRSVLFHNPAAREPKNKIVPSFGSTASRSPLERPSALPPIRNGTSVILNVRP